MTQSNTVDYERVITAWTNRTLKSRLFEGISIKSLMVMANAKSTYLRSQAVKEYMKNGKD